jgi:hypothetical protein
MFTKLIKIIENVKGRPMKYLRAGFKAAPTTPQQPSSSHPAAIRAM